MLVGGIGVVDLRVVGLWRRLPMAELSRALTPVAVAGLVLMAASGSILFAADGPALARPAIFERKLLIIAAALAHAAAFRRSEEHTPELQSLMRISHAVFCMKK